MTINTSGTFYKMKNNVLASKTLPLYRERHKYHWIEYFIIFFPLSDFGLGTPNHSGCSLIHYEKNNCCVKKSGENTSGA